MSTTLNHRVTIYVPSTYDGNKPARRMARKATAHTARVIDTARALCRWMKQEAVTVEIDGVLQFVTAE